jgi:AcrR family transcriptional regulator
VRRSAPPPSSPPRETYHHGNLRQALLDAAVALVQELGPDAVSVREVARRAGVSSGAPFRHFADKTALMTAVAEEGARHLRGETEAAMAAASEDPIARFRASGIAFVLFAVKHPGHFRVMNMPEYAGPSRSAMIGEMVATGTARTRDLVARAQAEGRMPEGDPEAILLAARALVYGLARLFADGHCAQMGIGPEQAKDVAEAVTGVLGRGLVRKPERPPQPARPTRKKAKRR